MDEQTENKQWYALRVTYRREMLVKSRFDESGVESYIPMQATEKTIAGKKQKSYKPLIHNLIFVYMTPGDMRELKAHTTLPVCYIMDRAAKCPAVIPDVQMNDFIALVALQNQAQVEIVEAHLLDLETGAMVRVTDGPFKGVVGKCIKSNGRSRVAVQIAEIAAALTAYIPVKYLEKIENQL